MDMLHPVVVDGENIEDVTETIRLNLKDKVVSARITFPSGIIEWEEGLRLNEDLQGNGVFYVKAADRPGGSADVDVLKIVFFSRTFEFEVQDDFTVDQLGLGVFSLTNPDESLLKEDGIWQLILSVSH